MTNEWDDYAQAWDDDPAVLIYAEKTYGEVIKQINPKGLRILDFGCGTGLLAERLARTAARVIALDGSEKMIDRVIHKNPARVSPIAGFLSRELIASHPQFQQKFDLITASSVCAFLSNYDEALALLRSVLLPAGTFLQWDWLANPAMSGFGMTEDRVQKALENAGFSDISLSFPFQMETPKGSLVVLMAAAKNT